MLILLLSKMENIEIEPIINTSKNKKIEVENYNLEIKLIDEEFNRQFNSLTAQLKLLQNNYSKLLLNNESMSYELNVSIDREKKIIAVFEDISEPLETLTGFYNIMGDSSKTLKLNELKEFALRMDVSTKYCILKIKNVLFWYLTQSKEINYKIQDLNLTDFLDNNLSYFKSTMQKKNISINHISNKDIFVKADKEILNYMMKNLISNAIKYSFIGSEINIIIKEINIHYLILILIIAGQEQTMKKDLVLDYCPLRNLSIYIMELLK
jgi:signal transduction histidine kinase